MLLLLFSLLFLIALAVFMLVGMLHNGRYAWYYSAMKLAGILLATGVSALLSMLIASLTANRLSDELLHSALLGEVGESLSKIPAIAEALGALVAMILAPMIFVLLFWILKVALRMIAYRVSVRIAVQHMKDQETSVSLRMATMSREEKKKALRSHQVNPLGFLCGALCGLFLCIAICIPTVGAITVADNVIDVVAALSSNRTVQTVGDVSDALDESAGSVLVRTMGGKAVYSFLTTYRVGEERVSLLKETEFLSVVGDTVAGVKDPEVDRAEASAMVMEAKDSFQKTALLPTLLSESIHAANEQWDAGNTFLGIKKPAANGKLSGIVDPALRILATSDADTIREDVATLAQIFAVMVEKDALSGVVSEPLALFENEDLASLIVYEILKNDHLSPLVGEISEFGIQMLGEQLGADMSDVTLDTSAITDKEAEAAAIAKTLGDAVRILHYVEDHPSVDAQTIGVIGSLLDDLSHTQMAGAENTDRLLADILRAERVCSSLGVTAEEASDLANKINTNAKKKGYTSLMQSLGHTVEVIQMTTDQSVTSEELDEKVEVLLKDLTPESAEVLETLTTPSIMQNHGVPEASAAPTANMISNMFGNLSDAKEQGMSDEEYQKEAKATTDLLNIAMNAKNSQNGATFGEGSATGKTASEMLDNVLDSKVISQTMVETVYGEGEEPVVNPLNMSRELQQTEQEELLDAMNDKWAAASEEEKTSEDYQKQYVAIGALLNLSVQVTEDGIVIA